MLYVFAKPLRGMYFNLLLLTSRFYHSLHYLTFYSFPHSIFAIRSLKWLPFTKRPYSILFLLASTSFGKKILNYCKRWLVTHAPKQRRRYIHTHSHNKSNNHFITTFLLSSHPSCIRLSSAIFPSLSLYHTDSIIRKAIVSLKGS